MFMDQILSADFKSFFWMMIWMVMLLGVIALVMMPFISNDKSSEENTKIINQIAAFTLLFGIAGTTRIIFEKNPSLAGVFIKSIFLPVTQEEEAQITALQISTGLLFLNTTLIATFSFFALKIIESALQDYAVFLTKPTKERVAWFKRLREKYVTSRGLLQAAGHVIFYLMLAFVLRSCGVSFR